MYDLIAVALEVEVEGAAAPAYTQYNNTDIRCCQANCNDEITHFCNIPDLNTCASLCNSIHFSIVSFVSLFVSLFLCLFVWMGGYLSNLSTKKLYGK